MLCRQDFLQNELRSELFQAGELRGTDAGISGRCVAVTVQYATSVVFPMRNSGTTDSDPTVLLLAFNGTAQSRVDPVGLED